MTAHRAIDILDGVQVEAQKKIENMMAKHVDVETGATYELLFGCLDEQEQTRGGIEGSGEHVVNLQKVEDLEDILVERVENYFKEIDGVHASINWSLGDTRGYKDHYVFFKLEIHQSLRSMWDLNIETMIPNLVERMSDLVKHLHTDYEDRTELILNASEHGKK